MILGSAVRSKFVYCDSVAAPIKALDKYHFCDKITFVKAVTERKVSSLSVIGNNADIQRDCGWCEQLLTDMQIHS